MTVRGARSSGWTKRFPRITEAALKNQHKHFFIDGEAIIHGVDGYSDFNALHSAKENESVELLAFDILALDGDDMRALIMVGSRAFRAGICSLQKGAFASKIDSNAIEEDGGYIEHQHRILPG